MFALFFYQELFSKKIMESSIWKRKNMHLSENII